LFNSLKITLIGFFYLIFLYNSTYSAQQITGEVGVKTTLRICADPNNLPYSSQDNEGYENKIADLFAKKLGNIPVTYSWYPMTTGFVRRTLNAKTCDLIVTFPAVHEFVQNSNPFYNSSYVLMSLEEKMAYINDDEVLEVTPKHLRLRKKYLDHHERKRISKNNSQNV